MKKELKLGMFKVMELAERFGHNGLCRHNVMQACGLEGAKGGSLADSTLRCLVRKGALVVPFDKHTCTWCDSKHTFYVPNKKPDRPPARDSQKLPTPKELGGLPVNAVVPALEIPLNVAMPPADKQEISLGNIRKIRVEIVGDRLTFEFEKG